MKFFYVLLMGYIIGSISFAVLVGRIYGVNILKAGSGNPGATNIKRVLGKGPGNVVFALDFGKGIAATVLPSLWMPGVEMLPICGLLGCLLGHNYSLFLKFRGGKGVAVTVGGLLVLMPFVFGLGAAIWISSFYAFRYVSLASILLGLSLPISSYCFNESTLNRVVALLLCLSILIKHRSNIVRLFKGTEHRFK
ncbi:MAG: acyl-phosphate glycerol 3-phosphate acyltransferase [Verrucomicrobia bacterium GWF2_51_19]|nr:MAG: acyl-phosphate glycerol 3-phosphate acyltransferase [Verrucomicrobia bacterium GWF2_51_19]HCJ12404.1 acyl-phosphate glycerol 3-phosphate acyltransferase [Opitutae bacterium]